MALQLHRLGSTDAACLGVPDADLARSFFFYEDNHMTAHLPRHDGSVLIFEIDAVGNQFPVSIH